MRLLFEGTKYDKNAIKELTNSGLYDEVTSKKIVDALFREDIPAFHGSGHAWLDKYIVGIIRMLIKYANGDLNKAYEFLSGCGPVFDEYLSLVKQYREKWGAQQTDDKFNNKMTYQDVKEELDKIKEEIDRESDERLKGRVFNESNYVLVPIDSYKEMHDLFGGRATGDGSSDKWAGGGGTAWCHTNAENVYDSWVDDGRNKFFVLANKDWKNIPFDPVSNAENYKDAYGNSLIAILAKKRNGILVHNTLRCNHVFGSKGVPDADNVYPSYAELSDIAGFNVKEKILENLGIDPSKAVTASVFEYLDETSEEIADLREEIEKVIITEGCTYVNSGAFALCTNLKEIEFRNTGRLLIGATAFAECTSLEMVVFPDTLSEIGKSAFSSCRKLSEVVFSNGLTIIDDRAFAYCESLKHVYIPSSVSYIGERAFAYSGLESFVAEQGALSSVLWSGVFYGCQNLEYIYLPESTQLKQGTLEGTPRETVVKTSSRRVRYLCNVLERKCEEIDIPDNGDTFIYDGKTPAYQYLSEEEIEEVKYGAIADGVTEIGDAAFKGLKNMISVVNFGTYGITFIGSEAFSGCTSLSTLQVPISLRMVKPSAFLGCTSLSYFEFPEGYDGNIPRGCFEGCTSLHEVAILSENIMVIESNAFTGTAIRVMKLPNGVEHLRPYVFDSCPELEYMSVPESLVFISEFAIYDCPNLKKIWCHNRDAYEKLLRIQRTNNISEDTDIVLVEENENG